MKRIKIVALFLVLFITTGCTVNYNIYIGDTELKEEFSITVYETENITKSSIFSNYLDEYPIYIDQEFAYYNPYNKNKSYSYYNKNYKEYEDGYIFNYSSSASTKDLSRLRTINTVFESEVTGYDKEEDFYYIALNEPIIFNNYNGLTSINVNIAFGDTYKIIFTNADSYNSGVYSWIINENSASGIVIRYQLNNKTNNNPQKQDNPPKQEEPHNNSSEPEVVEENNKENEYQPYFWLIFGGSILALLIVIIIGAKFNSRKR